MTTRKIARALLSVSDKTGLADFARHLRRHGVEIVSTGGTAKLLREAGIEVIDVAEITGLPEIMDGRVKTLHPKVHGGLLAVRGNAKHRKAQDDHDIADIDLLVVNLYPFEQTVARGADYDDVIENIDIGGPAMIRAAAKNHDSVTVVVDASDYQMVLDELEAHRGGTTLSTRKRLAAKAYARTAAYDTAIARWFDGHLDTKTPDYFTAGGELVNRCAMVKIRISMRRSTGLQMADLAFSMPSRCKARSSPTTTSMTLMPHSKRLLNFRLQRVRAASSSSMPIRVVLRRQSLCRRLTARRWHVIP